MIGLDWVKWEHMRSVGTSWDQMIWDLIGSDQIILDKIICDWLDQNRFD